MVPRGGQGPGWGAAAGFPQADKRGRGGQLEQARARAGSFVLVTTAPPGRNGPATVSVRTGPGNTSQDQLVLL